MTSNTTRRAADHPAPSPAEAKELPFAAVVHYDEAGVRYLSAVEPAEATKHLGDQEQHGRQLWFTFSASFVLVALGLVHLLQFLQDQQGSGLLLAVALGVPAAAFCLHMRKLLKTVPGAARIVTAPCPFPVPDRVLEDPRQAMQVLEQLQWADSTDDLAAMHRSQARHMLGAV
ncbi:hypothetical protein [Kocuria arenosa]|uniref:hypothetical protein n=1 Tax=Kocuria arenosa TaxID=3071446 RepID=UPI0034D49850